MSNNNETHYRSKVSCLVGWCSDNNLSLDVEKTKEIVLDFSGAHTQHAPPYKDHNVHSCIPFHSNMHMCIINADVLAMTLLLKLAVKRH